MLLRLVAVMGRFIGLNNSKNEFRCNQEGLVPTAKKETPADVVRKIKQQIIPLIERMALLDRAFCEIEKASRNSVLRMGQLPLTGAALDQATWKIWQYCRENDTSLDSEKYCTGIRGIVEAAVMSLQERLEEAITENATLKDELKEKGRTNNELRSRIHDLRGYVDDEETGEEEFEISAVA